jgi:hypothetical protein
MVSCNSVGSCEALNLFRILECTENLKRNSINNLASWKQEVEGGNLPRRQSALPPEQRLDQAHRKLNESGQTEELAVYEIREKIITYLALL